MSYWNERNEEPITIYSNEMIGKYMIEVDDLEIANLKKLLDIRCNYAKSLSTIIDKKDISKAINVINEDIKKYLGL